MDAKAEEYDVVVVGGGAAGLNAALVLARARRRVVVVDGGSPRNAPAAHVHGFLSRDGTPPAELLRLGRAEVTAYGGELIDDQVVAAAAGADGADGSVPSFVLRLAGGRRLRARRVLVAAGLADELPEIPGVRERWGRDVLHCPYCHGWEVRDQPLGVLATTPDAVHHALLVRQWSPDVVLFPHTVGVDRDDRERLTARGVQVEDGEVARLVVVGDRLRGVELADRVVPRAAVFVRSTLVPHHDLLAQLGCTVGDDGWVVTDPSGRTSVPGVWAAGNVTNPQALVVAAASAGAGAATMINFDLVQEEVDQALRRPELAAQRGAA